MKFWSEVLASSELSLTDEIIENVDEYRVSFIALQGNFLCIMCSSLEPGEWRSLSYPCFDPCHPVDLSEFALSLVQCSCTLAFISCVLFLKQQNTFIATSIEEINLNNIYLKFSGGLNNITNSKHSYILNTASSNRVMIKYELCSEKKSKAGEWVGHWMPDIWLV